jgi:hypothetical protein
LRSDSDAFDEILELRGHPNAFDHPSTRDHTFFCSVNLGTSRKRRETSRTDPVERDVLARIRRPLKLEAERIDGIYQVALAAMLLDQLRTR